MEVAHAHELSTTVNRTVGTDYAYFHCAVIAPPVSMLNHHFVFASNALLNHVIPCIKLEQITIALGTNWNGIRYIGIRYLASEQI